MTEWQSLLVIARWLEACGMRERAAALRAEAERLRRLN
jgi:hypothetical protein